jgi:benzoylsuccinyl-CoA thiolase BbsA subunit
MSWDQQYSGKGNFIEEGWFKDSAEGVVLVGSRCETCKKVFFPKKEVCPECFSGELKEVSLSKKGKLHSFTLSVIGIPGMETPYVVGFVDLPEGIKLFSVITDCEPWDKVLKIDMEMEMVIGRIRKDEAGNEILSYKFRPINKGTEI